MPDIAEWMKSSGVGDFLRSYGPAMGGVAAAGGLLSQGKDFLFGTDPTSEPFSTLHPWQEDLQKKLSSSLGDTTPQMFKFLQQFMGNDEESFNQFAAPYLRHFQTNIVPTITERFGGGESGASSGLMNAQYEAGRGLEQGLASARQDQGLKAAQQMQGLYSSALSPSRGSRETPGQPGAIGDILKLIPAILAML